MFDARSGGDGSGEWALLERPEPTNYIFFNGIFFALPSSFPGGLGLAFYYAYIVSGDPLAFLFLVKSY